MPTELIKKVTRRSSATIHEKSQRRAVILSLEPTAAIGVRLAGTRQTYKIDAEVLYSFAVKQHELTIDRRAKAIRKATGKTPKAARAAAAKELRSELE